MAASRPRIGGERSGGSVAGIVAAEDVDADFLPRAGDFAGDVARRAGERAARFGGMVIARLGCGCRQRFRRRDALSARAASANAVAATPPHR